MNHLWTKKLGGNAPIHAVPQGQLRHREERPLTPLLWCSKSGR